MSKIKLPVRVEPHGDRFGISSRTGRYSAFDCFAWCDSRDAAEMLAAALNKSRPSAVVRAERAVIAATMRFVTFTGAPFTSADFDELRDAGLRLAAARAKARAKR